MSTDDGPLPETEPRRPSPLTPAGWLRALRNQFGSVRTVYLGRERLTRHADFDPNAEIVLLLHGFFQTRNVWEVMEDRLRHDGYRVMSFHFGGLLQRFNTQPIERIAHLVAEKVERLSDRHGFERLHLIGHSKGGLIARRYVQHHGGARRAKSVITLGTPHHGTPTALLALPFFGLMRSSAPQLLPYSGLVRRLNNDTFPATIPLTSVYSTADLVCPYRYSILRPRPGESSITNVQVRGLGHTELVYDAGVYRLVRQRLQESTTLWSERTGRPA